MERLIANDIGQATAFIKYEGPLPSAPEGKMCRYIISEFSTVSGEIQTIVAYPAIQESLFKGSVYNCNNRIDKLRWSSKANHDRDEDFAEREYATTFKLVFSKFMGHARAMGMFFMRDKYSNRYPRLFTTVEVSLVGSMKKILVANLVSNEIRRDRQGEDLNWFTSNNDVTRFVTSITEQGEECDIARATQALSKRI